MSLTLSSPHTHAAPAVSAVMLRVIYALIPGIACAVWFFGWGIVITVLIAVVTALAAEAAILKLRDKPVRVFLLDGSALVTAVLLGISLPPLAPWWITVVGTLFAIVVAKHLYGGLGYNTFNPAMVGYVVLLISFPVQMTSWQAPTELTRHADTLLSFPLQQGAWQGAAAHALTFGETAHLIFTGDPPSGVVLDALTTATPLDTVRTQLRLHHTVPDIVENQPIFGHLAGVGSEWVALAFFAGGLWLLYKRVIQWHIPAAILGGLLVLSTLFWWLDPAHYVLPTLHLIGGASLLGAFFIATDPVTAPASAPGRLLYGVCIAALVFVIRDFGNYPDAVAFAVLVMNLATPTIDHYIQPRVFGHGKKKKA